MRIPKKIRIGGQSIDVTQPNVLEDGKLGLCRLGDGIIKIAETFNGSISHQAASRILSGMR